MDTQSPGTVPGEGTGVPENGTPNGSAQGDAADLQALFEQRLKQSSEETFRGIQSILDRNLSRQSQQTEARIGQIEAGLNRLNGYFETASTANLSDEEKQSRTKDQLLAEANARANQNALYARIHAVRGETLSTLASMGITEQDGRINWDPMPDGNANLLLRDPDQWGRNILTQAAHVIQGEYSQKLSTAETQAQERIRERQNVEAERARTQAINAQRAGAPNVDTRTPDGGQMTWQGRMAQMTPTQRMRLQETIQRRAQAKLDKFGPGTENSGLTIPELDEIVASVRF